MKIEKLFQKIGKFFDMDEESAKNEKKAELILSLDEKIESIKEKIKEAQSKRKKEKLKKQLSVLEELKDKI